MEPRPYVLNETNWKTVKEEDYKVVILPWGATEAHNYHLPFGTDVIQCDYIAAESARIAWEGGVKSVVLPTVPFGVNTGQADIKLDLNLNPSTQLAVLRDLVEVFANQGLFKLLIINGHGGNDFKQMVREVGLEYPEMFISVCNWYKTIRWEDYFEDLGDHAGEMETSIMMHITPDWVLPLSEAGDGTARKFKIKGIQEGWAWAERQWSEVTKDTGIGDPTKSTPQKGKACLDEVTSKIASLIKDIAAVDINDLYE